ncbi:hypothetical protein [Desulfotruncus alcoholivorax]|uniref:hypothetical protein n=1 Tax=Desulfotruncus alcoholivorax TaxID=265477 RepID=UPI0003F9928A|nr:hypothetical protein [Desulfotruncus alcoholivorax]
MFHFSQKTVTASTWDRKGWKKPLGGFVITEIFKGYSPSLSSIIVAFFFSATMRVPVAIAANQLSRTVLQNTIGAHLTLFAVAHQCAIAKQQIDIFY